MEFAHCTAQQHSQHNHPLNIDTPRVNRPPVTRKASEVVQRRLAFRGRKEGPGQALYGISGLVISNHEVAHHQVDALNTEFPSM